MKKKLNDLIFLGHNILIEPIVEGEEDEHGLIKPTQYEDKTYSGLVLKVGEQVTRIHEGDIVYFSKYAPTDFEIDAEKLAYLNQQDVIGVLRENVD